MPSMFWFGPEMCEKPNARNADDQCEQQTQRTLGSEQLHFPCCIHETTLISVIDHIPVIRGPKSAARAVKKSPKISKKMLASHWPLPLEGNFERHMPSFCRSKKIQKSEKKACQGLRNLLSLPKPNQT